MAAELEDGYQDRYQELRGKARCRSGTGQLVALFYSEQLDDIARAKAICAACPVREPCFETALARREPYGVWGGRLFFKGRVLAVKRPRGRPPKARPAVAGDGAATMIA